MTLIKDTPEILKEFPALWEAGEMLRAMNLNIISGPFFPESFTLMQEHHLLITDAVHIAAMNKEKVQYFSKNSSMTSYRELLRWHSRIGSSCSALQLVERWDHTVISIFL
jgi:predicted nucleic acid-binding protein